MKVNQKEIRFSLHTESRQQALVKAINLIANMPEHLLELRRMADNTETKITNSSFLTLITQVKAKLAAQNENEILLKEIEDLKEKLKASTSLDIARRTVITAYDKGQIKAQNRLEQKLIPWDSERTPFFSELKNAYLKSVQYRLINGIKKPLNSKTLEEYTKTIDFFITVMGDLRIGDIDRAKVGDYFFILQKLPPNISKIPKYRGKTLEDIIAFGDTPQSEVTISKKIERVSTMFKWAIAEKHKWGIDSNPFVGFGQADNAESKRRPFTLNELTALLSHPNFTKLEFNSAYSFWLIPIGLFSGARLREI